MVDLKVAANGVDSAIGLSKKKKKVIVAGMDITDVDL